MSPVLKAVFFDYGGTLDANGVAWKERFATLYRRFGVHVSLEKFEQAFYRADDSLVEEANPSLTLEQVAQEQVRRVLTGLEIFGGDAIVTAQGRLFIIDLNAWPSFALFRQTAAAHISDHIAQRVETMRQTKELIDAR